MSIPKEPRQLMINLMYLVLTALLALNVSAEVMNAFFSLDKGLKNSRGIVEKNNEQLMEGINKQADAYKKPENEKYRNNAKQAQQISAEFSNYIDGVRSMLFEKAKGPSKNDPDIPKDIRNKDITTRIFVNEKLGDEIEAKIRETRANLLTLADNDPVVTSAFPLDVEQLPANTEMKSWSEFKFKQMPVAAVFPILGKIQSDAKNSATAVLNYCATKVGGTELKFDAFQPAISAPKGYVIRGEKYEADIFLSAYSTQADNINISVNGSSIPLKDGIAHYETTASGLGSQTYKVRINVTNPLTKEVKPYEKDFTFEVGQRSVAVALDKMNVFYIGVDNPISVSAAGVNSNEIKVVASGVNVKSAGTGPGKYIVTATTPGEAKITVSGGGVSQSFDFRVKRIPDPNPRLGGNPKNKGGRMGNGEFKAQGGMSAILEGFDFDAKCEVVGFEMTYLAKRQDPISRQNSGARWSGDVGDFIQRARPGDAYFFDDVKCRCPGDVAARNIGGISYKIN
jgi:gliding motility-associated protein GldM